MTTFDQGRNVISTVSRGQTASYKLCKLLIRFTLMSSRVIASTENKLKNQRDTCDERLHKIRWITSNLADLLQMCRKVAEVILMACPGQYRAVGNFGASEILAT